MKLYGDYHTHTLYSDGVGSIEANLNAARKKGLSAIAISDHGFNNPSPFSLRYATAEMQARRLELLRDDYKELKIYHAIEADIISTEGDIDMRPEQFELFDFILAGFHRFARPWSLKDFFKLYIPAYISDVIRPSADVIRRNTRAFCQMIKRYPVGILAHIDDMCIVNAREVAKCCADYGTLLELNAKHIDLTYRSFDQILSTDVKLIADTDAHYPQRIGCFEHVIEYLLPYPEIWERVVNAHTEEIKFRKYEY